MNMCNLVELLNLEMILEFLHFVKKQTMLVRVGFQFYPAPCLTTDFCTVVTDYFTVIIDCSTLVTDFCTACDYRFLLGLFKINCTETEKSQSRIISFYIIIIYLYYSCRNSKFSEKTLPCERRVSTISHFFNFYFSNITAYEHEKCFIFLKYYKVRLHDCLASKVTMVTVYVYFASCVLEIAKSQCSAAHDVVCRQSSDPTRFEQQRYMLCTSTLITLLGLHVGVSRFVRMTSACDQASMFLLIV